MEGLCAFHTLYSGGNLDFTDFTLAAKTENNRKEDLSRVGRLRFKQMSPHRCDDHAALPGILKGVSLSHPSVWKEFGGPDASDVV